MTQPLDNRQPMSDEQRRAMFARLRRGGGSRSGGDSASTNETSTSTSLPEVPTTGNSSSEDFQSLEAPKKSSGRKKKSSGLTLLSDSERDALWTKLREGATDTRTQPSRAELSDERLIQIDQETSADLDTLERAIKDARSKNLLDQFQTKFVHAVGDIAGGIGTAVDPFEKLLDDPNVTGPLTRALQDFATYTHTAVPDVPPEGAGAAIAAMAGEAVPYIAGGEIAGSISWLQKAVSSLGTFGEVISSWKTHYLDWYCINC